MLPAVLCKRENNVVNESIVPKTGLRLSAARGLQVRIEMRARQCYPYKLKLAWL